jgi:hypothetical protein
MSSLRELLNTETKKQKEKKMKNAKSLLFALSLLLATSQVALAESTDSVPKRPNFSRRDASTYGRQLAEYMDQYNSGWTDQYFKAEMTLFDSRGDGVRRQISQQILEGKDGDKSVVRFLSPAEIRGVSALIHEHPRSTDDSWLYLPSSRRVRRISGANRTASFQGTEFTYEDLSSLVISKYSWRFDRDATVKSDGKSQKVFVLEAKPNYSDSGYSRLLISLNQKNWRIESIEYFDKAGRKLKTLRYSAWKHLHNRHWRAKRLEMANHQTRKRTVLDLKALFVDLSRYPKKDGSKRDNLRDSQFTRRALEGR